MSVDPGFPFEVPLRPVRVLHFSDVHVDVPLRSIPLGDWHVKRILGALNLLLRRGREFRETRAKLQGLADFAREERIDLVIASGDHTALGTDLELAAARAAIAPLMRAPLGFVNVPGNHDIYVGSALRERRFERHFGDTLWTDLPEHRTDGPWPIVRLIGEHLAVVAVNSARPNPQPWRSSGAITPAQLEGLATALGDPRVSSRFVLIVTHYGTRRSDGSADRQSHGMANAEAFLRACAEVPRGAILHGHLHERFHLRVPGVRPPIFCAGSTTQAAHEGFWIFEIGGGATGGVVRAIPGRHDGARYLLEETRGVSL